MKPHPHEQVIQGRPGGRRLGQRTGLVGSLQLGPEPLVLGRGADHERQSDSFVDRELARRLENGEQTVCEEIPCLSDPDDDPPS